jgi:hypothetical protein
LTYDEVTRPELGPVNPFDQRKNRGMNSLAGERLGAVVLARSLLLTAATFMHFPGHVEEQAMDENSFLRQQRTFAVHGYALNPSQLPGQVDAPIVGSLNAAQANGFASIENIKGTHAERKENKRKRAKKGDASVVDGENAYVGPWAAWEGDKEVDPEVEEEAEEWRAEKKRREEDAAASKERMKKAAEEKSIFHGGLEGTNVVARRPFVGTGLRLIDVLILNRRMQANRSPTILDGRTCTSPPTWVSTSIRRKERLRRNRSCQRTVYTPGYVVFEDVSRLWGIVSLTVVCFPMPLRYRRVIPRECRLSGCSQRVDTCCSVGVWTRRSRCVGG